MTTLRAAAAGVLGAVVLVGCSPQPAAPPAPPPAAAAPTSTPAPPRGTPETCAAAANFQAALDAIVGLDVTETGPEGVQAALRNLATAGKELADAASEQFGPQAAEVEQALASLEATIARIGDQSTPSAELGALATALAQVGTAAKPILDSVRAGCPDEPPAPTPEPV